MLKAIHPRRDRQPNLGDIVVVNAVPLQPNHRYRRYIVESFPADRSVRHCCTIRDLANGTRHTVSGFFCETIA